MIIYDLKCKKNHKFEGWFKDRTAFEAQRQKDLITCPVCGETGAEIVPSTLAIMSREMKTSGKKHPREIGPLKAMQVFNEYLEKSFDDVGESFAKVAIKIQNGDEEARNIKGTTTHDEEELLREEGIPFLRFPS